jgi:hypothetical protein
MRLFFLLHRSLSDCGDGVRCRPQLPRPRSGYGPRRATADSWTSINSRSFLRFAELTEILCFNLNA